MAHTKVDVIMGKRRVSGLVKRRLIFSYLVGQPDHGIATATEILLSTEDRPLARHMARYLEAFPGLVEEKARAAERLRQDSVLVDVASHLVPWLPGGLLDGFIADYLDSGDPESPVAAVIYGIATYTPAWLHPFAHRLEGEFMPGLLSGADDGVVDEFTEKFRRSGQPDVLRQLALVRTEYALARIRSLRGELNDTEWELLVALAGGLPHREGRASHQPTFMGFIAAATASPHTIGGPAVGEVPLCPGCEAPAMPLLSLGAAALPYELTHDPVFHWYSCTCLDGEDSLTVRVDPDGLTVYSGLKGPAEPDCELYERSLVLEEHRNQSGVSMAAVPGHSKHQVGGLPQWLRPVNHPRCPECFNPMPFMASVNTTPTPFGPVHLEGTAYCFWCDDCRVSTTLVQN